MHPANLCAARRLSGITGDSAAPSLRLVPTTGSLLFFYPSLGRHHAAVMKILRILAAAHAEGIEHTFVLIPTIAGRTMVPRRFISESLSANVQWVEAS
jgi:hypothetical protein